MKCTSELALGGVGPRLRGVLGTYSGMVLDDISLLKASWYLRLSTSFFIWGTSHSSMASGASEVASLGLEDTGGSNSQGAASLQSPPQMLPPQQTDTQSTAWEVPRAVPPLSWGVRRGTHIVHRVQGLELRPH